jgi:hypothetical protein
MALTLKAAPGQTLEGRFPEQIRRRRGQPFLLARSAFGLSSDAGTP